MRFLNPKTDFAFKKIFGSTQSTDILLSFLNAVLGLQSPYRIAGVTILDPYQAPRIVGMKDTYVDVRAVDETGRQFIVEMQVLNVQGFEQRVLYNACKAYAGQIQVGEDYRALTDVIALTITDFVMFPERLDVVSKFKLRAHDGELYGDDLELVFAELPKFDKDETQLDDIADRWFYFLKRARDLTMIPAVLEQDPPIMHAFDIANRAGLSEEEDEAQSKREIFIQDQIGALMKAKAEGEAKGFLAGETKGRADGKAEGEQAERLRIARSLLPLFDDEKIAGVTGLDIAAVRALRH
ncbi:MAG: Rpn family recombination-promoting nuclease/putative transposase [Burkholderiales bacterium]|nr:Rpn family recombination-promoting nuclease/putative transposase [Burkholderiales bacterium]